MMSEAVSKSAKKFLNKVEWVLIAILAASVVLGSLTGGLKNLVGNEVLTAKVVKSERVCKNDVCKYLVFTKDEVFENTDTVWRLKWNSSDLYAQIENGGTYSFKVYGVRFGYFSWYRNIVSVGPAQ